MASIFTLDKQVAKLPKHGFSMSQPFDFTSSTGQLLPVYQDILNPGEKISYSCDLFTRTQPLSSPANVDIDEWIDLFFVPLKKISSVADNILFQISDVGSSNFVGSNGQETFNTQLLFPVLDFDKLANDNQSNPYLGTWNSGLTEMGAFAPFFDNFYPGAMRLMDHLGFNPLVLIRSGVTNLYKPQLPLYFHGVYQAIYYDYFRLSNWHQNHVYAYNFDHGYTDMDLLGTSHPWSTFGMLREVLQLRYRARNKDYFTNVFPSPLISNKGMLGNGILNLNDVNQWLSQASYTPITSGGSINVQGQGTTEAVKFGTSYGAASMQLRVSTASLRTMFAVDKLMKITARAGKHYDDQVLAHFGFKVPKGFSDEVVHLGTHHQLIHIGEVISTASTETGEIGELAGKGYGKDRSQLCKNFVAPCHGFVMAIYSCAPRISYIGGLDRINTLAERYSWFIPALDNLGMQPLFTFERADLAAQPTAQYAWQLRYMPLKCKPRRATHAFISRLRGGSIQQDGPFSDWIINDIYLHSDITLGAAELGALLVSPMDLNQIMLSGYVPDMSYSMFYDSVDNLLTPEVLYTSDPLIHHLEQTVTKVSAMSIYGLDDKAI